MGCFDRPSGRKRLSLNGEMSEWLKEHAWKAKCTTNSEQPSKGDLSQSYHNSDLHLAVVKSARTPIQQSALARIHALSTMW
jgi:hypothetical protein